MTKELIKINGQTNFMGIDIPVIEGGFGENQKCVLAKDIAVIHNAEAKTINQNIKRLIDKGRIKEKTHYIDLLTLDFEVTGGDLEYKTSNGQKTAYLLSERGYSSLIKYMDDDKSWEVHDNFVDQYFIMKEVINSDEQLKANLLLNIYKGGQEGILASKQLTELEVKEAVKPLADKIEQDKPLVEFGNQVSESANSIDMSQFAKLVKDEHIKLGRNQMFDWLRDNCYLRKNNEPYQQYINQNIFETKEYTYKTPYGVKNGIKTLITGKGQIYLVEKLRKEFCN